MKRILVVEDEPDLADALSLGLSYKGFTVQVAPNGKAALERIRTSPQDMVLLDVMLPDMDGFEVCRRLRDMSERVFPILLLTARDGVKDKIAGFDSGADDYITKPFDFEELLAHIRAGLRRFIGNARSARKMTVRDLSLDSETRQVWREGCSIELTKREYELLELLMQNAGHVLTKERIFERIWGYDNPAGFEVIKVYINYLRVKINIDGRPDLIHTVRGVGYVLKE